MVSEKRNRWALGVIATSRQVMPKTVFHWLLFLTLPFVLLLTASNSATAQQAEDLDGTIQYLITYVRESGVKFERNFGSHDSVEAAEHIENKYRHFKDEIDTPEKFIELSATASLVTGKKYMVITEQGEEIPAGEWLNAELKRYRLQNGEQ
ncbi:MAG: DUF5329 family protein [Pseudomonadota bacterium]